MVHIVETQYDAIIIGGGVAGLAAARRLSRAGLRYVLLEGRNRLGGRIHTLKDRFNFPVELGAEFVHGKPPGLVALADEAKAVLCQQHGTQWYYRSGQLLQEDELWSDIHDVTRQMAREKGKADRTFREFLDQAVASPAAKAAALRYVEHYNAADASKISVQSLIQAEEAEQEFGGGDRLLFRVSSGYSKVVDRLVADCDADALRLSSIAKVISWRAGNVNVICENESGENISYSGKCAIITLPLGVLKARGVAPGAVRFVPALKAKELAMQKLVMGNVVRMILVFKSCFWERLPLKNASNNSLGDLSFLFTAGHYFDIWWTQWPLRVPMLVGWSSGYYADKMRNESDAERLENALYVLTSVLPISKEALKKELLTHYMHDWEADPFSCGAYSYPGVGGIGAQADLAEPVERTLFFAGEATNTDGHFATVHGALSTGERAALQVIDQF